MQRFGEKLRSLRERRGISLRQLATALGFSAHTYLGRVERGQTKPSLELVLQVSRFFDISTDQLMKDELELD